MTFAVSQCSGHTSEYVLNDMPLAHALQYQAMYLHFNGSMVVYPKHFQRSESSRLIEQILNG